MDCFYNTDSLSPSCGKKELFADSGPFIKSKAESSTISFKDRSEGYA